MTAQAAAEKDSRENRLPFNPPEASPTPLPPPSFEPVVPLIRLLTMSRRECLEKDRFLDINEGPIVDDPAADPMDRGVSLELPGPPALDATVLILVPEPVSRSSIKRAEVIIPAQQQQQQFKSIYLF